MSYPFVHTHNVVTLIHLTSLPSSVEPKTYLQKLMRLSLSGTHIQNVCSNISDYLMHPDIVIKKLACWLVSRQSGTDDSWMLVVNTLSLFSQDANPLVRTMALKTITSIRHHAAIEHTITPVTKCLDDDSVFVKRAAVNAVIRLSSMNRNFFNMHHYTFFIQKLKSMVQDKAQDEIVLVDALLVLLELLSYEVASSVENNEESLLAKNTSTCKTERTFCGSKNSKDGDNESKKCQKKGKKQFPITKPLVVRLLSALSEMSDCHKSLIICIFSHFLPDCIDDVVHIMNKLDCFINKKYSQKEDKKSIYKSSTSHSLSTSSSTALFFIRMTTTHLPKLKQEVLKRSCVYLLERICKQADEVAWASYCFILTHCPLHAIKHFIEDNTFVGNPVYLKVKKIQLLARQVGGCDDKKLLRQIYGLLSKEYLLESNLLSRKTLVKCVIKLLQKVKVTQDTALEFNIIDFLLKVIRKEEISSHFAATVLKDVMMSQLQRPKNLSGLGRDSDRNNEKVISLLKVYMADRLSLDRLPQSVLSCFLIFLSHSLHWDREKNVQKNLKVDSGEAKSCQLPASPVTQICLTEDEGDVDGGGKDEGDQQALEDLFSGINPIKKSETMKIEIPNEFVEKPDYSKIQNEVAYKLDEIIQRFEMDLDRSYVSEHLRAGASEGTCETLLIVLWSLYLANPSLYTYHFSRVFELCYSHPDPFLNFKTIFYDQVLRKDFVKFEHFVYSLHDS